MGGSREVSETDWLEQIHEDSSVTELHPIPLTSSQTFRAWEMILDPTIPHIIFPEPEGHWHFKLRRFYEYLQRRYNFLREIFWWLRRCPIWYDGAEEYEYR